MAPVGNAAQVRYMSERQDPGYQPLRGRVRAAALFPRPIWGSERAFVLASVAGVVGLGNLWRFPYMAGENGGGSFLAAYLICVLIIAIPLAIIESTAGSVVQRTPVDLFRRIAGRPGAWFGWLPAIVTAAIMSYYFVITGWTLGYAVQSLGGTYQTFVDFTDSMVPLLYFFIVAVLVLLLLIRGVAAIERASLVLLPVLVVVVVGLAIYAQTTEGAGEAAQFYFRFESDRFFSPGTWQKAAGQSFYSLGVGQGILIVYGSFVPAGTNSIRSTISRSTRHRSASLSVDHSPSKSCRPSIVPHRCATDASRSTIMARTSSTRASSFIVCSRALSPPSRVAAQRAILSCSSRRPASSRSAARRSASRRLERSSTALITSGLVAMGRILSSTNASVS